MTSRKAVSETLAVLLIIFIAVAAAVATFGFISQTSPGATSTTTSTDQHTTTTTQTTHSSILNASGQYYLITGNQSTRLLLVMDGVVNALLPDNLTTTNNFIWCKILQPSYTLPVLQTLQKLGSGAGNESFDAVLQADTDNSTIIFPPYPLFYGPQCQGQAILLGWTSRIYVPYRNVPNTFTNVGDGFIGGSIVPGTEWAQTYTLTGANDITYYFVIPHGEAPTNDYICDIWTECQNTFVSSP